MSRKPTRIGDAYANFFLGSVSVGLFSLFLISSKLRPISDDYCAGSVVVSHGLFGGILHVYKVWSGDVFSSLITYGLVGLPLRYLDFRLASALPFILAFVPFAFLFFTMFKEKKQRTSNTNFKLVIGSTIFFYLSWHAALWTYNLRPGINTAELVQPDFMWGMSLSTTYFQNVNTAYVFTPGLIALLTYLIFYSSHTLRNYKIIFLGLILGLIVGTSGAWIVLTYVTFQIGSFVFRKLRKINNPHPLGVFISLVASIIGLLISINSPGTKNRRGGLTVTAMENPDLVKLLTWTIGGSFQNLWAMLFSGAALVVFFTGIVSGVICSRSLEDSHVRTIRFTGFVFLGVGVLSTFIVRASEAFAYPAYWHFVGSMALMSFGIHILGISFAVRFLSKPNYLPFIFLPTVALVVLFIFFAAHNQINARQVKWQSGPAPISGFADIETKDGYVDMCWNILKKVKQVRERQVS